MHDIKLIHISKHISKHSKHTLENLVSHPAGTEFIVLEEAVSGSWRNVVVQVKNAH